jgi:hypothetical protein
MTATVFPCYAPADRPLVENVAAFLERGADVRVLLDEGALGAGEDLAAKARQACSADIALIFFSRGSLPPRWPRSQWEGPLVNEPGELGVRIAFLKCDDCCPPRVLEPQFDAGTVAGWRKLKRWLRGRETGYLPPPSLAAELDLLGIAIADRPGCATASNTALADEFADAFAGDFDGVFRLECGGRTLTALAGDLGSQLGMTLEGDLDSNLARLSGQCSGHRLLIVLDNVRGAPPNEFLFGGLTSVLVSPDDRPEDLADPLRQVQHAFAHSEAARDWSDVCALARQGRRLTREQGRIAECYELMSLWHAQAEARGDREALNEAAREMVWILESWGRTEEASRLEYRRAAECDDQFLLPF